MMPKAIKRCLVFLVFLSIISVCSAQPNVEWEKTFGEGAAHSVQQTSDGSYVLAGVRHIGEKGYVSLVKVALEKMPPKQPEFEAITPTPTPNDNTIGNTNTKSYINANADT